MVEQNDPYANLSEYKGDTTICRKCGNCCKSFSHYLPTQEAWRIRNLEGNLNIRFYDIGDGWTRLRFDYPCRYLKEENGYFTCRIHETREACENRPNLCKHYPQSFLDDIENVLPQEAETCPIIAAAIGTSKMGDPNA